MARRVSFDSDHRVHRGLSTERERERAAASPSSPTKKEGDSKDELYQKALEIIKIEGKASTSFLQRKLQIGYNRAARIIDMMEANGEVSKANHVGKREVLK